MADAVSRAAGAKPRLFVTFSLPPEVRAVIADSFDAHYAEAPGALARPGTEPALAACELVLVTATDTLDAAAVAALPASVRAVATYSVGHEHIDLAAARARGLAIYHTPDVLSEACAEVGLLLLLGAARRATESIALVRGGGWQGWTPLQLNGWGLTGKRLGVVGMGRIGREIATRARAFGMEIHYYNRSRLAPELEAGAQYHASAESLLPVSQFLMLACPATADTIGFLNAARIAQLPRGAIVGNIARGSLVVDEDLVAALQTGQVAAAGLDVFNHEPDIHPAYFDLPNCFMLPHIGSATIETRVEMGRLVIDSLQAFLRDEPRANRLA